MPRSASYLIASLLDEYHKDDVKASCSTTEEPLDLIHKKEQAQEVPECSHNEEHSNIQHKSPESYLRRTLPISAARNQQQSFSGDKPIQSFPCMLPLPAHQQNISSPYLTQFITTRSQFAQMQQTTLQWSPSSSAIPINYMTNSSVENITRQLRTNVHHYRHNRFRAVASENQTTVKKHRCDICDKTFSRSNTLVTHKRIHTGEKPFHCDHCGRAFRQPGNLTRHRLTHTTIKPYVCSMCDKAFNRASNLHTHMRTHSQT